MKVFESNTCLAAFIATQYVYVEKWEFTD